MAIVVKLLAGVFLPMVFPHEAQHRTDRYFVLIPSSSAPETLSKRI